MRACFEAKQHVTQSEFARFNRLAVASAGVDIVEWVPRVLHAERAAMGQAAARDGVLGFALRETDAQGELVPVAARPDYYPLWFLSQLTDQLPPGFDLGARSANRAAMALAAATARPTLVQRQTYPKGHGSSRHWRLFVPIYRVGFNAELETQAVRSAALRGFAVAVIDPVRLWAEVAAHATPERLVLQVASLAGWNQDNTLLTGTPPRGREDKADWVGDIEGLADPRLQVQVWSLKPWLPAQTAMVQIYCGAGLLVLLLTGVFAFRNGGQKQRMAREIERRSASEQSLQTLIENIPAGVIVYDREMVVRSINSAVEELLHISASDMVGHRIIDFEWNYVHEDGTPFQSADRVVKQVLLQGRAVKNVIQGLNLPGRSGTLWALVSAAPLLDVKQQITQVVVTFMDISARKRLEERERSRTRIMAAISSADELGPVLELLVASVEADDLGVVCTILLLDASGKRLHVGAAPSLPDFLQPGDRWCRNRSARWFLWSRRLHRSARDRERPANAPQLGCLPRAGAPRRAGRVLVGAD